MIWINLVAGVAAVVAAARAWRMLARRRGLRREVEASCIVRWQQPSPSGRGAAPRLWFVILGHGLSVIIVCVLLLGSLNRAAPGPLSTRFETPTGRWLAAIVGFDDPQLNSIGWVAAVLAAFVAGTTLGALLGFGLVTMFGPPVSVGVTEDGVWFGVLLLPWRHVCSARLQVEKGEIVLFSRARPESDPASLSPPTKKLYEDVEGMLGIFLARNADETGMPRRRGEQVYWLVIFGVALIEAVAAAFAVYPVEAEWVWFFYGLELVALSLAGRFFLNRWLPKVFIEG